MRRRDFITSLGSALAWPLGARAQAVPKMLRVGMVSPNPRNSPFTIAFNERLRELGYVEGQNYEFDFVDLKGKSELWDEATTELIRRNVDVVIASGAEIALKSALKASNAVPIVMVAINYDPLALGYVAGLARPGGNITGVFCQQIELAVKRLELMKEAFPDIESATVFWDEIGADQWRAVEAAAPALRVRLSGIELRDQPYDYERALSRASYRGALMVMNSGVFFLDRQRIAEAALQHRIASMFGFREFVDAGGLLSLGPSITDMYRHAANYVDRIARGAKPTDLPIERPTKFEFVINLKTARTIGIEVPTATLVRADVVIE